MIMNFFKYMKLIFVYLLFGSFLWAAPTLIIKGGNPATIEAGSIYTDAGAEANDTIDGNLTSSIATTSNVNSNIPGDYSVTYRVKDSSGNEAYATRV